MKYVSSEDGFLVFQKFFADVIKGGTDLVLWQFIADGTNRLIHHTTVSSYKPDKGFFQVSNSEEGSFKFAPGTIFGWVESEGVIFKTEALSAQGHGLSMKVPEKLAFLEGPELQVFRGSTALKTDVSLWKVKRLSNGAERSANDQAILGQGLEAMSILEEDKLFADKREAPRVRAKGNKRITVCVAERPDTAKEYPLFDLSRGGLSYVVEKETVFGRGMAIHVMAIEDNKLDSPLAGEVMSVRALDDGSGFKVGVKFVDEL